MRRIVFVSVLVGAVLMVPVRGEAGGGCHRTGSTTAAGTTVELSMNCMSPSILHTAPGEVTFVNRDEVMHNVWGSGWGDDSLRAGESFTHRFGAGTYLYSCTLHPGMIGSVVVGDGDGGGNAGAGRLVAAPAAGTDSSSRSSTPFALGLLVGLAIGALGVFALRR